MRINDYTAIALILLASSGCGDTLGIGKRLDGSDRRVLSPGKIRTADRRLRTPSDMEVRLDRGRGKADIGDGPGARPRALAGAIRRGEIGGKTLPDSGPGVTTTAHEAMPDIPDRAPPKTRIAAVERVLSDLSSPIGQFRFDAAINAGAMRINDAVPGLLNLVERNGVCAAPAIRALGQIGGDRAARAISKTYGSFNNTRLDMLSLRSLGYTRSRAGIKLLTSVLRKGDVKRRIEAAHALGFLGKTEAAPHLRSVFKEADAPYQLRIAAACALARMGLTDGLAELQIAVARGGPEAQQVAIAGLVALVQAGDPLGDPSAAADRSKAVRSIASALGSPYPTTWRASILALATMRPINAMPVIGAMLKASSEVAARARLAQAAYGGPGAVEVVRSAIISPDRHMRAVGCDVAAVMGDRRLVEDAVFALRDSFESVRVSAVRCLGILGGGRAVTALRQALSIDDEVMRAAAGQALSRIRAKGEDISSARASARPTAGTAGQNSFELERVVRGADGASFCVLRLPDGKVSLLRQGESAADGYVVAVIGLGPGGGGRVVLERGEETLILKAPGSTPK